MSFILKSIELKNIKAHTHLLFEPALEGITAISGENGAGKSTVVDSLAWCLYGIRPSGIRNKNFIKDGVDPRENPVSVKTTISISGIEYIIERKILTASGVTECNVWGKKTGEDKFTHVAGPAVSHVEKLIKSELGMNEKGFLTSVLIQQKQVDQIVSASPRERGVVIEELTGIASITQAIQKTNENTRALEKAASIFTIGNIDEAKSKVKKQLDICNTVAEKENEAINKFKTQKELQTELKREVDREKIKVDKRISLNIKLEAQKAQVDLLKKQAEDDINFIIDFRNKYGTTVFIDPKSIKEDTQIKRNKFHELSLKLKSLNDELKTNNDNIKKTTILKGDLENIKKASELKETKEKELTKLEETLIKLKETKTTLMTELKHSKASYKHITGTETSCPVCKSTIENPETLKKEIETEIKEFEVEIESSGKSIIEIETEIKELKELIKNTNISIEAMKEQERLLKLNKKIEKEIKASSKEEELAREDLRVSEVEYDKALRIEADKRALDAAKERSLTVNGKIDKSQEDIKRIEEEIKELGALTDISYSALERRYKDGEDRLMKMSIAGKELMGRKSLEQERLSDNKKNLEIVEDAMEKYNELANQIEISTSAASLLTAFKTDRIENAIPTLEFFASDFLSKFTGGAFTKMTIDEKFNTFVETSSGIKRPVAQLSGGELSSAAIALRLGIAMLLNSSDKNVLILDEVLVSMDEDRSRQIMETIGSISNSQVIFIAHNTDINAIADKTVLIS